MRPLALMVVTAAGWGRSALIAACSALVSGLLLVAVSMTRIAGAGNVGWDSPAFRATHLMAPLADPGTRGGTVFAVVLLTLPVLALLNQGVRLGTTARLRRYDALTVAGATRRELRGWGALEVGAPAAAGSVLGIGVWWVLREVLGRGLVDNGFGAIVPPYTGPGPWAVLVVAGVAAIGVLVGARSLRTVRTARETGFPLVASGLFVIGALLLVWAAREGSSSGSSQLLIVPALVGVLVGITGIAPWLTVRTARAAAVRARSGAALLAARRLSVDPRPATRAALAAGAGGLTLGALGVLIADVADTTSGPYDDQLQTMRLVAVLTAIGFLFVGLALAVHIADTVVSERRAYAALSAAGFTTHALLSALRWEALMATLPVAVAGSVVGSVGLAVLAEVHGPWVPWSIAALAATIGAVIAATFASAALVAPIVRGATGSGALRTE